MDSYFFSPIWFLHDVILCELFDYSEILCNSELCSKILSFDNTKQKNGILFCIVLTYSYLCNRNQIKIDYGKTD